ncbi:MAG: hypothetical protein KA795_05795 [Burkholderiaceae bacterium]|nr:hypothetical protein [Burkholderiaceae bacterium]
MASEKTLARLDTLIWVLIYGGLFAVVFGFVLVGQMPAVGWALKAGGAGVALAGVVLIAVRARLRQDKT